MPAVTTADFCGGQLASATVHGTAVAEIVHEMAPGAQLYLDCVDSGRRLCTGRAVRNPAGHHDHQPLGRLVPHSRGDGSGAAGTPDAIVADARAHGIAWVDAAGNEGTSHWSGSFIDTNSDGVHEFVLGGDVGNSFNVGPHATACAFLRWDAWPVTTEDYDLYIINSVGTIVARSESDQSATPGHPTEAACYQNPSGSVATFAVAITRCTGGEHAALRSLRRRNAGVSDVRGKRGRTGIVGSGTCGRCRVLRRRGGRDL